MSIKSESLTIAAIMGLCLTATVFWVGSLYPERNPFFSAAVVLGLVSLAFGVGAFSKRRTPNAALAKRPAMKATLEEAAASQDALIDGPASTMVIAEHFAVNRGIPRPVLDERARRVREALEEAAEPCTIDALCRSMRFANPAVISGLLHLAERGDLYELFPDGDSAEFRYSLCEFSEFTDRLTPSDNSTMIREAKAAVRNIIVEQTEASDVQRS